MIERNDLDRTMTSYFESRSTNRAPDGLLDAAMTRVETTRQRPAILVLDRWLPADRSGVARMRTAAIVALTVALLLASAITVGLIVGSQHRLPPPFGLAKPGLIAVDPGGDIYVENADGTGRVQLTSGSDVDDGARFSPDGTLIAYRSELADMLTSVIVMSPDGSHEVTIADHLAQVGDLAWSPDSRRIAFGARLVGSSGRQIYLAAVDHPGVIQLSGPDTVADEPAWSPDGTKIAFKRLDPMTAAGFDNGTLWIMGADGSNPHPLGNVAAEYSALRNLAWSPDGKRLAFAAPGDGTIDGSLDVFVINADGTGLHDITNTPQDEFWPSWSPDGRRIAFPRSLPDGSAWTLVVADADGSNQIAFSDPLIDANAPTWSPDGTRVLAHVHDGQRNRNTDIAVFDPLGIAPTVTIPADNFGSSSWQRLAP